MRGSGRHFAAYLARRLVPAQTLERRMADLPILRPLREDDFGDELRRDPMRVLAEPARGPRLERALALFDPLETPAEIACHGHREPGPYLAAKRQPPMVV